MPLHRLRPLHLTHIHYDVRHVSGHPGAKARQASRFHGHARHRRHTYHAWPWTAAAHLFAVETLCSLSSYLVLSFSIPTICIYTPSRTFNHYLHLPPFCASSPLSITSRSHFLSTVLTGYLPDSHVALLAFALSCNYHDSSASSLAAPLAVPFISFHINILSSLALPALVSYCTKKALLPIPSPHSSAAGALVPFTFHMHAHQCDASKFGSRLRRRLSDSAKSGGQIANDSSGAVRNLTSSILILICATTLCVVL